MLATMIIRVAVLVVALTTLVVGQDMRPTGKVNPNAKYKKLILDSGPGSFRAEGKGTLIIDTRPDGVGTVYISQYQGAPIQVEGMRLEYRDKTRLCYHGIGRLVVSGTFRAVNYLGSRMKGSLEVTGEDMAFLRVYGDLDKNLHTGLIWYEGYMKNGQQVKQNWETFGLEFHVPMPKDFQARPLEGDNPVGADE